MPLIIEAPLKDGQGDEQIKVRSKVATHEDGSYANSQIWVLSRTATPGMLAEEEGLVNVLQISETPRSARKARTPLLECWTLLRRMVLKVGDLLVFV